MSSETTSQSLPFNAIVLATHGRHILPYLKDFDIKFVKDCVRRIHKLIDGPLYRKPAEAALSIHDLVDHSEVFTPRRERAIILLLSSSHLQELISHLQRDEGTPEGQELLTKVREQLSIQLTRLVEYPDLVDTDQIKIWAEANQQRYKGTEYAPPPGLLGPARPSAPPTRRPHS